MKRLTALFVCLLLVTVLVIPALAAAATVMTITTEVTTAKPGDEIEFRISMSGSDLCTSFGLLLEYDSTVFEVVEGKCTLDEVLFATFDKDKGLAGILQEPDAVEDEVGTFVLRVKAGAPSGKTEVSGTSSVKNGSATVNSEVESVKLTISGNQSSSSSGNQSSSSSGSQSSGSSGNQSSGSSGMVQQPEIGDAEAVIATVPAAEETTVAETTPETPAAPEAVLEEVAAGEEEKADAPEAQLIETTPETEAGNQGLSKDMIVIIVAGVVVLMAAVLLVVALKKCRG